MAHKMCSKCKKDKDLSEFNKCSRVKDGRKSQCRECQQKEKAVYDNNNPAHNHEYYITNKDIILHRNKEYVEAHREQSNQIKNNYIKKYPEKRLEQSRRYYANNKHKRKEYVNANRDILNEKKRIYRQTHPQEKIAHNLRTRISSVLSGKSKGGRLFHLVGCNMDFLKSYIELFWEDGMSWSNYGKGIGKWSLDHTIPLEVFDLTDEQQQLTAFNYSNMRPMWYSQNAAKGSLYNGKRYYKKKHECQGKI